MRKPTIKLSHVRSLESTKPQKEEIVCLYPNCGRVFSEPIRLTVVTNGGKLETYNACPYCFSKVTNIEFPKIKKPSEKTSEIDIDPNRNIEKTTKKGDEKKVAQCPHSFGYLSKRPKGSPIPDECLLCSEITKCLLR